MEFEFLKSQLESKGFKVDPYINGSDGMLIMKGPKFRIRAYEGLVNIGFNQTFDRWANSTDWTVNGIPQTEEDVQIFLNAANSMQKCHYCDRWDTPHKIANRPCCDLCFRDRNKVKRDKR